MTANPSGAGADPGVPHLDLAALRTEIGIVLRQVEMTAHRDDALPPAYPSKPTAKEWRERAEWLVSVLKRASDAMEAEHLTHRRLAAQLSHSAAAARLVGSPEEFEEYEVCLGCGRPTAERDCGCPAGTGMRRRPKRKSEGA